MRASRLVLGLVAPAAALVFALAVSSLALVASGNSPATAFSSMLDYGTQANTLISVVNRSVPLYLSALAVAVGFKMGLFNIGVEGQYRLAALLAAAAGAAVRLPAVLHVALIVAVGVATGAAWAGVAGVLKVTRGVHEVISTIMLNFVATGLSAYLLGNYLREESADLNVKTPEVPASGRLPSLNPLLEAVGVDVPRGSDLYGFVVLAALVGLGFYLLVWRTRFGYDLRASGVNPWAARASGVDPNAMVVRTMLLSGALAGLVGLSQLLGFFNRYSFDFPSGLGFSGIAVALLGRNNPVGMAAGALLFGFMSRSAQVLDLEDIPKEIVDIMQGSILLSVVVAYEVVRRAVAAREAKAVAGRAPRAAAGGDLRPQPAT